MTPSKTLSLFSLLSLVLAAVWLALVWQWPWADLWRHPDSLPLAQAAVQMAVLPEIVAAFLAGGLLALASSALQQIVHNPLASDSTFAVAGGAQLSLMLVTLFFPAAGLFGSFWVAFAGAVAAMLLVLVVAGAGGANALALILAGLLANMVFAAIAAVISQFYSDLLLGIMVWGAGSLLQDGWAVVAALLWTSLAAALLLALLHRPLSLLALDDAQARRLGAPVGLLRLLVLLLAAGVTAQVVSRLGVISFAGLAGASVAHLLRVRAVGARFALSFLAGGLLLVVDSLLNIAGHFLGTLLPAGALCGVLGAPFLIFLVLRQRKSAQGFAREAPPSAPSPRLASWRTPLLGLAVLLALLVLSQGFTAGADGWGWHWQGELILDHRLPRSLSAMAVGVMLACAGVLLQTLTRNPMASPEVLGISSGVALAVIAAFLAFPALGSGGLLLAARAGVALAHAVFWAITSALAMRLAPPGKAQQAIGWVAMGSAMATVLGLPLGRLVGQAFGWRATFALIALVAAAVMVAVYALLPRLPSRNAGSLRSLPLLARRPRLLGLYAFTALIVAAHFTAYSYIEPFARHFSHLSEGATTALLLVFGLSGMTASVLFARYHARLPTAFLASAIALLLAALLLLRPLGGTPATLYALVFCWGIGISGISLCLMVRVLHFAPDATDVATAIFSGIYNIGIGGGALIGQQVM